MKFCHECGAAMSKSTTTGVIEWRCRCQLLIPGIAEDTLMAEEWTETTQSNLKHEVFIENAPFDNARNIITKQCLKCGLDFMTMIRVGDNELVMYTCTCGFQISGNDYNKTHAMATREPASEATLKKVNEPAK